MQYQSRETTDGPTLVGYQPVRQLIGTHEYIRWLYRSLDSGEEVVLISDAMFPRNVELTAGEVVLTDYPWIRFQHVYDGSQKLSNAALSPLVEGVTLAEFVQQQGPLNESQLLSLAAAVQQATQVHPELLDYLTPDSVVIGFNGEPFFIVGPSAGVGSRGCLWYAVTGIKPLTVPMALIQFREDLPRLLQNVLEHYFRERKTISDVVSVLHRLTTPVSLQLGILITEKKNHFFFRYKRLLVNVVITAFTVFSLGILSWQLWDRMPMNPESELETTASGRKSLAISNDACRLNRIAHARSLALSGKGNVEAYVISNSPAAFHEMAIVQELKQKQLSIEGLSISMSLVNSSDTEQCDDPAGMFAWLPVGGSKFYLQERVEMVVSGHWQRTEGEERKWKEELRQELDVTLRVHHGSWLLEEAVVVKDHVQ